MVNGRASSSSSSGSAAREEIIRVKKERAHAVMSNALERDDVEGPASKRLRVDEAGNSRYTTPDNAASAQDESDETLHRRAQRSRVWERDERGYVPGSIVKVELHNFVTYYDAVFEPGPYLNMIIGPNGTGKSSIACALALGLNFPPTVLGRATDVGAFVKNDCTEGWIAITLKGKPGVALPRGRKLKAGEDVKIKRSLVALSRKSTFTVNGVNASPPEVNKVMAELDVGVGNLCSFLPQDKVSSFAAMTPVQLLRETQRAAGDVHLIEWHDTLISAGKELRDINARMDEESKTLEQMILRNEGIERDVERFKERKVIEEEKELLELLIPRTKYQQEYEEFTRVKKLQRKLHGRVKALRGINAPVRQRISEMDAEISHLQAGQNSHPQHVQALFQKLSKIDSTLSDHDARTEKRIVDLDHVKRQEKARQDRIQENAKKIEELTKKLAAEFGKAKEAEWEEKVKHYNEESRDLAARNEDASERLQAVDDEASQFFDRRANVANAKIEAEDALKSMDQASAIKLNKLSRWSRDTADVVVWLRKHKHLFNDEIFEPPYLSVDVPDKKYADAIDACFNRNQVLTFVAQNQHDSDKFNHLVNDTGEALGRKVRVPVWYRANEQRRPPPMEQDELQQMGFVGYALEFIEYPQGMLPFLRGDLSLGRIPIGLKELSNIQSVIDRIGGSGGGRFIAGRTLCNVIKSAYGNREASSAVDSLKPARNFVNATVDASERQEARKRLAEATAELESFDEGKVELEERQKKINAEMAGINDERNALQKIRDGINREKEKQAKLGADLRKRKGEYERDLKAPTAEKETAAIMKDIARITKARIAEAEKSKGIVKEILKVQHEHSVSVLEFLQLQANRRHLERLCDERDGRFQQALNAFQEADEAFKRAKAEAGASKQDYVNAQNKLREQEKDHILRKELSIHQATNAYKTAAAQAEANGENTQAVEKGELVDLRSYDELLMALDECVTKLEIQTNANPGVVEQYEKRKEDIERGKKTLEEYQVKKARKERDIKNAKDNWQPALQTLIKNIGARFSKTFDSKHPNHDAAGEIHLQEDEDFEKWAINIMVKFRGNERLQTLTAQRQSGGERSLTTIIYLMSLSAEARAPFSLVDEINQGMDQRAERFVHNSLVDITCNDQAGQYFLITPKLLSNLNYDEKMKVLIVNNGEWLPDEAKDKEGNMMRLIDQYCQAKGL
ncbi:hypothetical protein DL96DRAFT_1599512 [Flagelloscypha sp. PMI_526]|nr:hypothetical protein DL96DRAFT_1599512 [Flagelloscypha sp. PMI_526]